MSEKPNKPDSPTEKSLEEKAATFESEFQAFQKAAADAKSALEWEKAVTLYSQCLEMLEKAPEGSLLHDLKFDLLDGRAACYNRLSDLDAEENDLEAMLSIAQDIADISRQVMIYIRLVDLYRRTGKPTEGLDIGEKALAMARQVGNQKLEADCLNVICIIQSNLSNLALSLETGENALRLYRELDDRLGQSDCLRGLSFTLSRLGQSTKAQAYAEQALEIARLSGDREKVAYCFNAMGLTYTDYAKQRDYEEQALSIFDSMGLHAQAALTRNNLGLVNWSLGLYGRARDYLEQAVDYARRKFLKGNLSYYLDSLGRVYCSINEIERSKRVYEEGLRISENINDPSLVAAYKTGLGRVAMVEGKFPEAWDFCLASSQQLSEIESLEQVTPLAWLGAAYLGLGDVAKACQVTGQAVSILSTTELGNIEYPPQEVWWWRYRALAAQPGKAGDIEGIFSEAWAALDKARVAMLNAIKTLSDEGLRRNYFNKVEINRLIIQEWVKNAARRGIPLTGLTDLLTGKGDLPGTLKRLLEIGVRLNAERDPGLLPRFIMDEVVELSGAERAVLYLVDNHNERRIAAESFIDGDKDKRKAFLEDISPLLDEVCQNLAPVLRFTHEEAPAIQQRSILCVPLIARGKLIGLVYIDLDGMYGRFSLQDLDLLNVLANQAAVAIENAGWASTLEHRVEERTNDLQTANNSLSLRVNELAIINSVGEAMSKQLDVDTITHLVGEKVRDIFQAETIGISLYYPQEGLIRTPYGYDRGLVTLAPIPFGTGLTSKIIQSRQPMVFGSDQEMLQHGGIFTPHQKETDVDTQSYMGVPIIVGDKVLGVVDVQSYRKNAFDDSSVRLLNTLSSSMGVAIENARLFQETQRLLFESQQRAAELEIINSVGQALAAKLEIQAVFDLVGDKIREIFDAQVVILATYNDETNLIDFRYIVERGKRLFDEPQPLGQGFAGQIIRSRQPLLIGHSLIARASEYGSTVTPGSETAKSYLGVPLLIGDQARGSISLQNLDREEAFDESDLRVLTTLASSMSVALENARLFSETNRLLEESRQRAAELATINTVGQAATSELDLHSLIHLIGDQVCQIFKADIAYIAMYDRQSKMINFPYSYGEDNPQMPLGPGLTSKIIETDQPLLINQNIDSRRNELGVARVGKESQSYLGVPISVGKEVLGVISVQSTQQEGRFGENDMHLLSTIAANVGAAINNARLYQETQRRANEMAVLAEIGSDITATHDLQPVLQRIVAQTKDLLRVRDIVLCMRDGESDLFKVVSAVGDYSEAMLSITFQEGVGMTGSVLKNGIAEIINYPEKDRRGFHIDGTPDDEIDPECMIIAPLVTRDHVIGSFSCWRKRDQGLFVQSDLDFLVNLARQAAIAIESARLYLETQRRANEMSVLAQVGREISATLDLPALMQSIATYARNLLASDTSAVFLLQPDGHTLLPFTAVGESSEEIMQFKLEIGQGIIGHIVQHGKADRISDTSTDPRGIHIEGTAETEANEKLMVAPLTLGERTIGAMAVWRDKPDSELYSQSDLDFLVGLSQQVVVAIENARLFEEIRSQKRFSESLIHNSPVAIVTQDMGGQVTSWNPAAERLFGYSEDEAVGQILDEIVTVPENRQEFSGSTSVTGSSELHAITRRCRKDGSYVDVELLSVPVVVSDKETGSIVIYHDITELKAAKEAADSANEAKSSFLATMSHEIRTPMNGIIGMTSLLLNTQMTTDQREFTETIRDSSDALLTIINDILDFSKIEAGKMELEEHPFDLIACMESALDLLRYKAAEKGLDLAYQMDPDVPVAIVGDVTRLRQIIINLLNNSVKFTEQGEVVLSVSVGKKPEPGIQPPAYQLHFSVCDTGIGIPADRLGNLFKAFSQVDASTSRKYGGTGLGLAICKRLSEMMGGDIWVESQLGEGSTFHFTILAQAAPQVINRPHLVGEKPQLRGKRLLVVDDNATNRRIVSLQSQAWGMQVRATASPQEALAWISHGDPFDLAILDMQMPEMDGQMLANEIRKQRDSKQLPIVLFSSLSSREDALDAQLFVVHLLKPLKPSALFDVMMNVFEAAPRENRTKLTIGNIDAGMALRLPLRILLAEDNVVNQKLAMRLLSQMGYRADLAANGIEAIQSLERQIYDVILMDVQMPELDGLEAARRICARWPRQERPQIVAMTANAMQGDRERCLEAGMDDYVSKPINVEELVTALTRIEPHKKRSEK